MPRRAREADDDHEEEPQDELEQAEARMADARRQGKSKNKDKSKSKGRKSGSSRRDDDESDDDVVMDDDEGAGRGGKTRNKLGEREVAEKARELVRLAICNEASRRLLKRDEINKKVLSGNTRAFPQVFRRANVMLKNTFGMVLVDLFPQNIDESAEKARAMTKKKQDETAGGDNDEDEDDDEEHSQEDDDDEDRRGSRKKGGKGKKKGGNVEKHKKGSAKTFCLRTTLDVDVIRRSVKDVLEVEDTPDTIARLDEDVRGFLGDAAGVEVRDWKRGQDAIFDWKTGTDSRALMGILYIILALILVNERVLTDDQLMTHLKKLDLHLDTAMPLTPSAMRPEKHTLNTFLSVLLKQGYLEKTKLANGAASKAGSGHTQGSAAAASTQRVRATQATQRAQAQRDNDDLTGPAGNGSSNEEWRWGARSVKEIGEVAIAAFLKDFYKAHPGNDAPKQANQLQKEILRGANGGKAEPPLLDARDGDDED